MNSKSSFGLLEILAASAIFLFVATAIFGSLIQVRTVVERSERQVLAIALLNERIESVRSMPYGDIGVTTGTPNGIIQGKDTVWRGGVEFDIASDVRYIDIAFDGYSPNDLNPQDQKLVTLTIGCVSCKNFRTITGITNIGPKSLEADAGLGSLFVNVIDASGRGVSDAVVKVMMASTSPVNIAARTGKDGQVQLVGIPPAYQRYAVSATKAGYTTDRNYDPYGATTTGALFPYATVVAGVLAQITLIIDRVSAIDIYTVGTDCVRSGNVQVRLTSEKEIIAGGIREYDRSFTVGASGYYSIPDMKWGNYDVRATRSSGELLGSNPVPPVRILPGVRQAIYLTMTSSAGGGGPNNNAMTTLVRDAVTRSPIYNATVTYMRSNGEILTEQTGRGSFKQTSWRGGGYHSALDVSDVYDSDFGFVDTQTTPGIVKLTMLSGNYQSFGGIVSSTIDTGSPSNFYSITFNPKNQPASTTLRFQLATSAASTGPWSFVGPDGTASTFFDGTIASTPAMLDNRRYLRYKAFLNTASSTRTPTLEDVTIDNASACEPPGVASAQHLHNGSWTITASAPGYTTESESVTLNPSRSYASQVMYLNPI